MFAAEVGDQTMKPRLTVLLGSGSTLNLGVTPPDAPPIGMPSNSDLTRRIAGMEFPAALHRSVPILFGPDESQPFHYTKQFPISPNDLPRAEQRI